MRAGRALCAALDTIPGLDIEPFEHGSNIVRLRLDPALEAGTFAQRLYDAGVFVPDRNEAWDGTLLTFNPTLLRRPIEDIAAAFADARPTPAAVVALTHPRRPSGSHTVRHEPRGEALEGSEATS